MKRPYRDVLVWLAGIRLPDSNLFVERAIASVIALLAAYDRDQRLAARWEERFANGRTNNFPFGLRHTETACGPISRSKKGPPGHPAGQKGLTMLTTIRSMRRLSSRKDSPVFLRTLRMKSS